MAIYHLSSQVISHGKGETAIAAAAYRSGSKLHCEYTGQTYDYCHKGWVEHTEIMLPKQAPDEWGDREVLWNAIEAKTKTDERVAREFEVALPRELSMEESIDLLKNFCKDNFIDHGLVVDFAIHNPPLRDDMNRPIDNKGLPTDDKSQMSFPNPHCHVLTTMVPLDNNGKMSRKTCIEYVCQNVLSGEQKGLTASEFKENKEQWNKLYRYLDVTGKKLWLTQPEAEEKGYTRIHKNPKTTPYGRPSPEIAYLNSSEYIKDVRQSWQDYTNCYLTAFAPEAEQVNCKSYEARGIDKIPTVHLGPTAINMERRDKRLARDGRTIVRMPDRALINHTITGYNQWAEQILKKVHAIDNQISVSVKWITERLSYLRDKMILLYYRLLQIKEKIKELKVMADKVKVLSCLLNTIEKLKKESRSCNGESSIIRVEYAQNQLSAYGYTDIRDLSTNIKSMQKSISCLPIITADKKTLSNELNNCMSEYFKIGKANVIDYAELEQTTNQLRNQLASSTCDEYDETLFSQSVRDIDRKLNLSSETVSIKNRRSHVAC